MSAGAFPARAVVNFTRSLAISAILGGTFTVTAIAQTPKLVLTFKGTGYRQTSPTVISPDEPSYAIAVEFATPVPASTVVQLRGPVTINVSRDSPTEYSTLIVVGSESQLDASLPDGNYTLAVSGGGAASNTPVSIVSRPRIPAPLITNFAELQELTSGTFNVTWQPVSGGLATDWIQLAIKRGEDDELYNSPDPDLPGALTGRSTSAGVANLPIAAGETLTASLGLVRFAVSTANSGATGVANTFGFVVEFPITRAASAPPTPPVIATQPQSMTVAAGSTAVFNVEANGTGLNYQWRRNGANLSGATSSTLILNNAQTAVAGSYTVLVENSSGPTTSSQATLTVVPPSTPARIANLSIRTPIGASGSPLIVGFVTGGAGTAGTKPLLVRAVGPALTSFGVPGALLDPRLEFFIGAARIAENDNWGGDAQVTAVSAAVGAFALGSTTSRDAALYLPNLTSDGYTTQVVGVGGASGIALAEIYDASPVTSFTVTTPRLVNVSARSSVGTGGGLLIAGFVIAGPTARTVLVRAAGPALSGFGVASVLNDPQLALFAGNARLLGNDDWGGSTGLSAVFSAVGAFGFSQFSRDAALVATLPPGSYTAQVSGAGNTTGVALVEVYEVP